MPQTVEELYAPHTIEELYAQIPKLNCKQLCQNTCGPIGMSGLEAKRIADYGRIVPRATDNLLWGAQTCSALSGAGTCGIYEVRPMICRLAGVLSSMPCTHGCKPERTLSDQQGWALLDAAEKLSSARGGAALIDGRSTILSTDHLFVPKSKH